MYKTWTDLMVRFLLHVLSVHLHHSVPRAQSGQLRRRPRLDPADELCPAASLPMQVEPVTAVAFGQVAEPRAQIPLVHLLLQSAVNLHHHHHHRCRRRHRLLPRLSAQIIHSAIFFNPSVSVDPPKRPLTPKPVRLRPAPVLD